MSPSEIRMAVGIYQFQEIHQAKFPLLEICLNNSEIYERRFSCAIIGLVNALYVMNGVSREEFGEKLIDFELRLNDCPEKGVAGKKVLDFIGQSEEFMRYDRVLFEAPKLTAEILIDYLVLGCAVLVIEKWNLFDDVYHLNLIHQEKGRFFSSGIEMKFEDLCRRVWCSDSNYAVVLISAKAKEIIEECRMERDKNSNAE